MYRFKIKTLGCKVNQYESEALAERLERANLVPAAATETADVCIVNTCTVTGRAAMQSRQAIRQVARTNPGARVVVTGCYAQTAPADIGAIDGVDAILTADGQPLDLRAVLGRRRFDTHRQQAGPIGRRRAMGAAGSKPRRSRPFLKVQDGCEAFCSYCIVPHARGPSRSLPPERALEGIRRLKTAGYHEVVLTGIHLGVYGNDLAPPTDLLTLLRDIRQTGAIDRVRLSSIEPRELSDALLDFALEAAEGPGRICHHFHIPLQSGDDGILEKMHRPYTGQFFEKLVHKIVRRMPTAAIGVDVLVGFPGETEAAFASTRRLIENLPVAYLHVFPFSPRKGTAAHHFPHKVPAAVVKNRCRILRDIGDRKKLAFYRRFAGASLEVIPEERNSVPPGYLLGTSANYIPVLIKKSGSRQGRPAPVRIVVERVEEDSKVYGSVAPQP